MNKKKYSVLKKDFLKIIGGCKYQVPLIYDENLSFGNVALLFLKWQYCLS